MPDLSLEDVVTRFYAVLYRFALSLARQEPDAMDLVQQTFYLWTVRGHQLRDASKLKSWLFTTLYREHLAARRRATRFPPAELALLEREPGVGSLQVFENADADVVMETLLRVDEVFRTPLTLFYLEDMSYKQIAEVLGVPAGTVMSRLARGKEQMRRMLAVQHPSEGEMLANPVRPKPGITS